MTINNRGLSGQPSLPYVDFRSYAGADVFIDLAFLDHTGVPVQPTTLFYQVDDLTNCVNVIPSTSVTVTGTSQTVQIAGAKLQMTRQWQGSELLQIFMTATLPDGSKVQSISILELIAIQTP